MTIIGAGIHGSFLAGALIRQQLIDPEKLILVDPWPAPLALWRTRTAQCGMQYLRSTSSHNMSPNFHALRSFAREEGYGTAHFLQPYARPSLELFNRHAEELIREADIPSRLLEGRVRTVERVPAGWRIRTENAEISTARIILAIGRMEQPHLPDWARRSLSESGDAAERILHLFGSGTPAPAEGARVFAPAEELTILGGGVSAVQAALAWSETGTGEVTLVSRHPLRVSHFDSDPCYMGPRCLADFLSLATASERLQRIRAARTPGTIPWDVARAFEEARSAGKINFIQDDVLSARPDGQSLRISLRRRREGLSTDRLMLATGFQAAPPAPELLKRIHRDSGLPLNREGYPDIDRSLRWAEDFFVTSALAELELGPMGPNIYGAHAAARRILPALQGKERPGAVRTLEPWTPLRQEERSA